MGLSMDEFTAASKAVKGPQCSVALALAALDDKDRAVLQEALAAPLARVAHSAIARVLGSHEGLIAAGTVPKSGAIGNHRRGECRCARP